jgi:hypothetical protein
MDTRMNFIRFMVQFAVGTCVMLFSMSALATWGFRTSPFHTKLSDADDDKLGTKGLGKLPAGVLQGIFLPIITAINACFMPTPGRTSW